MKILWFWSRVSGYMAAGWKQLSAKDDIDLRVIAWSAGGESEIAFEDDLVAGLNCELLAQQRRNDFDLLYERYCEFEPDIVVVPGWMNQSYRRVACLAGKRGTCVFMGMDTPWTGSAKQCLTKYRYGKFLQNVDRVVVAGERAWQYARRLGFNEERIYRGVYTWDEKMFSPAHTATSPNSERTFLFVGRFAAEKGIDTLIGGYKKYRNGVDAPWGLNCAGMGPLESKMTGVPGVAMLGFVRPDQLADIYRRHTVLVLPSVFEPWGVVVAEAMGSGLPVIATEACGAGTDLIRNYYNGITVPTGCEDALSRALLWMHENSDSISQMSSHAVDSARPFSTQYWATRWHAWFSETLQKARLA